MITHGKQNNGDFLSQMKPVDPVHVDVYYSIPDDCKLPEKIFENCTRFYGRVLLKLPIGTMAMVKTDKKEWMLPLYPESERGHGSYYVCEFDPSSCDSECVDVFILNINPYVNFHKD